MVNVILWLLSVAFAAALAWHLGVRRERGRQEKIEEIQQRTAQVARRRKGTVLRTIKVRR